jgi:hypothetical protein
LQRWKWISLKKVENLAGGLGAAGLQSGCRGKAPMGVQGAKPTENPSISAFCGIKGSILNTLNCIFWPLWLTVHFFPVLKTVRSQITHALLLIFFFYIFILCKFNTLGLIWNNFLIYLSYNQISVILFCVATTSTSTSAKWFKITTFPKSMEAGLAFNTRREHHPSLLNQCSKVWLWCSN